MVMYVNNDTGNLSDGTKWDRVTNTPAIASSSVLSASAGNAYSLPFTAPNIINKTTGFAVYPGALPVNKTGTETGTLQISKGTVTMTSANPGIVTLAGHGFLGNEPVCFATTGALPTLIVAGTIYYVKYIDASTFNLSLTPGGANINTSTGVQSGVHTLWIDTSSTASFLMSNISIAGTWIYFRFGIAHQRVAITANLYRFKINYNVVSTNNWASSTQLVLSDFAYIATDDRTGTVPTTGDQIWVFGQNGNTQKTITIDANVALGTGVANILQRSIDNAITVGQSGILENIQTASTTLTLTGSFKIHGDGQYRDGTLANPLPAAYQHNMIFSPSITGDYYLAVYPYGSYKEHGAVKPRMVTYASGVGTAASPLITTGDIGEVGDQIALAASISQASIIGNIQYKYIITKNSSTSYVLSQTNGGTEGACTVSIATPCEVTLANHGYVTNSRITFETTGALPTGITPGTTYYVSATGLTTNTFRFTATPSSATLINTSGGQSGIHTVRLDPSCLNNISEIYNISRNISKLCSDPLKRAVFTNQTTTNGLVEIRNTRREIDCYAENSPTSNAIFDYNVGYQSIINFSLSRALSTYSYNICCKTISLYNFGISGTANKTYNNFVALGGLSGGFGVSNPYCIFNNCKAISCATASNTGGYTMLGPSLGLIANNCESHLCYSSFCRSTNTYNCGIRNNFLSNTKGTATGVGSDFRMYTLELTVQILFVNSVFANYGTARFWTNSPYNLCGSGTEFRFHDMNAVVNKHEVRTENGIMYSTGAGLPDTNVRTAGTLNLKLMSENLSPGLSRSFQVLATPGQAVSVFGLIQKNIAATTDLVTIDLYLPGSTAPDNTAIHPNNNIYTAFNVIAIYYGTVPAYATVKITHFSTSVGAAIYIADIYNGTNDITNLKLWDKAMPSSIMYNQLGDPSAVWSYLVNGVVVPGSTLEMLIETNMIVDDNTALIVAT